jgi:hypothetical protein
MGPPPRYVTAPASRHKTIVLNIKKILFIKILFSEEKVPEHSIKTDCCLQHSASLIIAIGTTIGIRRECQCNDKYSEIECEGNEMYERDTEDRTNEAPKDEMSDYYCEN